MARQRDWLRLTETLDDPDGEPSDRIVLELVRSFNHTRQETKRQRIFAAAALVLLVTAGIATWQAVVAVNAKDKAVAEQQRAERAHGQIKGTADRVVQSLALQARKKTEVSASAAEVPPCDPAHFKAYDDLAAAALAIREPERAIDTLAACLTTAETRVAEATGALEWRQEVGDLHQRLGDLYNSSDPSDPTVGTKLIEAEKHFQQATSVWRDLAANDSIQTRALEQLASSLGRLGNVQLKLSRPQQPQPALSPYRERVAILDRLASSNPTRKDLQSVLSAGYQQMADAWLKAGKADEALTWAEKDLASYGDVSAIARADPGRQRDLASTYDRRAQALRNLGRQEDARDAYEKGLVLLDEIIDGKNADPKWRRDAATMREELGTLFGDMGKSDPAIDQYWQALKLREQLATSQEFPGWLSELTAAYRSVSQLMLHIDRVSEGHEMAEQYLLAAALNTDADRSNRVRRALGTLCWSATNDHDNDRALWVGQRAIEISPQLDWVKLNYAHALLLSKDRKNHEAARQIYLLIDSGNDAKLKSQIAQDFNVLRKRGYASDMMAEIEAGLGKPATN